MWQKFLDLLAAARRPLAVLDFETAGLGGAPPVEFAVAYWAPWCEPAGDDVSRRARALCPPGLTYAASYRLDPLCPIDPEATAVHGIRGEDVRGRARPYNDVEVVSLFAGLAAGSPADGEGPAVFVGHNAAEADVPWARRWGYLPKVGGVEIINNDYEWRERGKPESWAPARMTKCAECHRHQYMTPSGITCPNGHGGSDSIDATIDVVDTMRIQRRLVKEHAHPLAPCDMLVPNLWDGWSDGRPRGCPAIGHGLRPYASNLEGLHTALFGDPHDGGHGALADMCATARCLAAVLEFWSPLWSCACADRDPADDLARLLAALDAPPPGALGWDGWLAPCTPVGKGPPLWGRKARKYVGRPLTVDPSYARWVCGLPSEPTGVDGEAWCSPRTREIIGRAIA